MQLKPPYRLRASDLPLIESPYFASRKVKRLLNSPSASARLDTSQIGGMAGHSDPHSVIARVARGELFLVYDDLQNTELLLPVVAWQADDSFPSRGYWRFNGDSVSRFSSIKTAVDALNSRQITPRNLSFASAVGRLDANNLDMEIRHHEAEKKRHAESGADSRPNLSLGAGTHIALLSSPAEPAAPAPLNVVAGLFLDGTLNNVDNIQAYRKRVESECLAHLRDRPEKLKECLARLRLVMGESYAGEPTNVVKLFDLYQDGNSSEGAEKTITLKAYEPGAGTQSGASDSLEGVATGLGDSGVPAQVKRLFSKLAIQLLDLNANRASRELTIDLFGFSRGAAAARHAANEILKGPEGMLGQVLGSFQVGWPQAVNIRFLGLFDTVAGIVNVSNLDISPSNDRNSPVQLYVDQNRIEHTVHFVARHEKRENFALNSLRGADGGLPSNAREIALPGAHSDIGGGYHDLQTEDVLLYPSLDIRGSNVGWPQQTMEWDNLKTLKQRVELERWIGSHSLPLPGGASPALAIEESRSEHPSPDGTVTLSLRMVRQIRGEYSRVALWLMHALAENAGLPLDNIDEDTSELHLPAELKPIYESFMKQIKAGSDAPSLGFDQSDLIRQRYIHHSDHYNLLEGLALDQITKFEFPFDSLAPFRPASSRERTIHFNLVHE
ncbi:MAG: phospholipase effector Tle1 domain-containing protein [Marinobacter sp.]|uniref:phospholipase effector Tle1 domain-containing protein n=1 Tax=Marinobacter sp. TaxID=50741 RepID=UPI003F9E9D05